MVKFTCHITKIIYHNIRVQFDIAKNLSSNITSKAYNYKAIYQLYYYSEYLKTHAIVFLVYDFCRNVVR